jgi:hypothetical protein
MGKESYKKIIMEYYESHDEATVHHIIAYMKSPRVRNCDTSTIKRRGLRVPSRIQLARILMIMGAPKIGVVKTLSSYSTLWGRPTNYEVSS